jgi:hypothetical protein
MDEYIGESVLSFALVIAKQDQAHHQFREFQLCFVTLKQECKKKIMGEYG